MAIRPLHWVSQVANNIHTMFDGSPSIEPIYEVRPKDRLDVLIEFADKFEELVGVVVSAAQYGARASLESQYDQLRAYMRDHYASIQLFLGAYLKSEPEDSHFGIVHFQNATDAVETLWVAESLNELLQKDDGGMIDRITRGRDAIALYEEHLRYLVQRSE